MIDLTGQIFSHLTVICYAGKRNKKNLWECLCSCGNTHFVTTSNLRRGNVISCGCFKKAFMKKLGDAQVHHGHSLRKLSKRTPTYNSWQNMKYRCYNPNAESYHNYGTLGIIVCERWLNSFENFLQDMGERPMGKTLDRTNPFGNYEPSNCKWSTPKEQSNNTRKKWKVIPFRAAA